MMKKHTKRLILAIIGVIILVLLVLLGARCNQNGLNKTSMVLYIGDHYKLTLKKQEKEVLWKSENSAIVEVDHHGEIEAKKKGKTVFRAKTSKHIYRCQIRLKRKTKAL